MSHLLQSFPEPRRSTELFALLFLTTPTPSIQSFTHLVAFSWRSCTAHSCERENTQGAPEEGSETEWEVESGCMR